MQSSMRALAAFLMLSSLVVAAQDKPQLPKSQMPDLGRPTRPNDEQPLFNFDDYFLGTWKFSWDVPEGIFGPSGTIAGTVTYKKSKARSSRPRRPRRDPAARSR